ncbi:GAF domain-containing sensor histidine kinase [Ureibacillus endophyticus]|uniref:GAF domain-containing sensor histidine kinase n=1 Tax=Ureibacillus endophyticus TaxID=1978490 RepID=UPI0014751683|nr:GAF domain-containing sensor histidine kinase [Lysinibacillus endophyticus]
MSLEFQATEVKPLNESYMIVNRETLEILESSITNNTFAELYKFFCSSKMGAKKENFTIFFHSLMDQIIKEVKFDMVTASTFEVQINNFLTIEVKIYPTNNKYILFFKDNTKHAQVNGIIEENDQKLSILSEISEKILEFNEPKQILDSLFESLSSLLDVDFYTNYILDCSSKQIRLLNYHGVPPEKMKSIEILQLGEEGCGTVAETKQKLILEHVQTSTDPKAQVIKSMGLKAYICYPLLAHGKLLGTLSFGSSKRSTFSADEILLISEICERIAITLERVLLISNLKETNKELIKTNQQLLFEKERADKANNAKSNFLLLMSHELRTPLNSIMGYNQLLLTSQDKNLTATQQNQLEKMLNAGKQLKRMFDDMLDFVRYDNVSLTFDLKKVDINSLIDECIRDATYFSKCKRITIEFFKQKELSIFTDSKRLKQVFNNLLINAIKYNNSDGSIRIFTKVLEEAVMIEFQDTGIGIEENELSEIFKTFYRSSSNNPSIEGSGIGLSLSKQIINELGGSLTVSSKIGVGSAFTIKLPLN